MFPVCSVLHNMLSLDVQYAIYFNLLLNQRGHLFITVCSLRFQSSVDEIDHYEKVESLYPLGFICWN